MKHKIKGAHQNAIDTKFQKDNQSFVINELRIKSSMSDSEIAGILLKQYRSYAGFKAQIWLQRQFPQRYTAIDAEVRRLEETKPNYTAPVKTKTKEERGELSRFRVIGEKGISYLVEDVIGNHYTLSKDKCPTLYVGDRVYCSVLDNGTSRMLRFGSAVNSSSAKTTSKTISSSKDSLKPMPSSHDVKTVNSFRGSSGKTVSDQKVNDCYHDYGRWRGRYGGSKYHRTGDKKECSCCGNVFNKYQGIRIESTQVYFCYPCWNNIKIKSNPKPRHEDIIVYTPMGGQPGKRRRTKSNT